METAVIKIGGMTCGGCVRSVTNVLNDQPGVETVEVSLAGNEAVVGFDPAIASLAQLRRAIENAGFEAK